MARLGLNDPRLAQHVGVARTQPGKWRRGDTTPAGDTLAKLCAVLGVTPGYLFGEDEPRDELAEIAAQLPPRQRERLLGYARAMLDELEAQRAEDRGEEPPEPVRITYLPEVVPARPKAPRTPPPKPDERGKPRR